MLRCGAGALARADLHVWAGRAPDRRVDELRQPQEERETDNENLGEVTPAWRVVGWGGDRKTETRNRHAKSKVLSQRMKGEIAGWGERGGRSDGEEKGDGDWSEGVGEGGRD